MTKYTDDEIIGSIEELRQDLDKLLPKDLSRQLNEILDGLSQQARDTSYKNQTIDTMLEEVRKYPAVTNELKVKLIQLAGLKDEARLGLFEPISGIGDIVGPGSKFVCPIDPTHYVTRLREKGQRCPQHNVELILLESISPKADK